MATTTSFILAGKSHPNDGGINIYHCIQLTEGSAPAYTMRAWVEDELIYPDIANDKTKVMIPTIENALDDLLLMIMVWAEKDMSEVFFAADERIEMYNIAYADRMQLYSFCKQIAAKAKLKLVVSIIKSQSLLNDNQLAKLAEYGIEFQVLKQ